MAKSDRPRHLARVVGTVLVVTALFGIDCAASAAATDADQDGIPVQLDPDSDTTHYARGVTSLRIHGEYQIVDSEDPLTVTATVDGTITTMANRPFGYFLIQGKRNDGFASHKRWALVLGSGITAGSDTELYLAPTIQLCYDADNIIPWSFCQNRYLVGRGAPETDFRVLGTNASEPATGEWTGGTLELTLR